MMSSPPRPSRLLVAAAGAILSLVAACDSPVLLVVGVGLKAETCGTGDPRQIVLSCPATAGAWVRDGDGDIIDQECASVGYALGQPLDDLRTVFTEMDLNVDQGERVTVEVALFSRQDSAGCVPPGDLPDEDRPEVILSGAGSKQVSGDRGPVEVFVDCTETPARTTAEECHLVCADEHSACVGGVAAGACQDQRADCEAACQDDDCRAACAAPYQACLSQSVDGSCRLAFEGCLATGEQSADDCEADHYYCVQGGCGDQHDACFDACPSPGCALFPFRR